MNHSRLSMFDQRTEWLAGVLRKLGEIVVLLSVGSLIGLVIGLAVRWPK